MPNHYRFLCLYCCMALISTNAYCKQFSSSTEATELIELYTSEGCSSCPPADKWLQQLKSHPQLFKKFIPLAFHVDYWNQLGWEDRFSQPQFTHRQYQHTREGNISQVYTPGFVVNNKEWRNWQRNTSFTGSGDKSKPGILKTEYHLEQQDLQVSFAPESAIIDNQLVINVAILGMGLNSQVSRGENQGHLLAHDFVVLSHHQHRVDISNQKIQHWQIKKPKIMNMGQQNSAIVIWLSYTHSQKVIQATGGYL